MSIKLTVVVGARPQFIKHFALDRALREDERFRARLIHTGQHFDERMSAVFFDELEMTAPAVNLGISGGGHGEMTGQMLIELERELIENPPDCLLVYGDTNSTLAGTLTAAKLHIPIAHVEAGLRSFNRRMPEEINRVTADHLSRWLFCPTRRSRSHLSAEGISKGVHCVGDIMLDATLLAREIASRRSDILERLGLSESYAVATLHRAENTDEPQRFAELVQWLREKASEQPLIMPLHPRTRLVADRLGLSLEPITTIEPLGFLDMTRLLHGCSAVLTDSGGLQKEAYFHGKPCVTLRDETEWPETLEAGWNRLWRDVYRTPRRSIDDFGRGDTAKRILSVLAEEIA